MEINVRTSNATFTVTLTDKESTFNHLAREVCQQLKIEPDFSKVLSFKFGFPPKTFQYGEESKDELMLD